MADRATLDEVVALARAVEKDLGAGKQSSKARCLLLHSICMELLERRAADLQRTCAVLVSEIEAPDREHRPIDPVALVEGAVEISCLAREIADAAFSAARERTLDGRPKR